MRHWTFVATLALVGATALGVGGCGSATTSQHGAFAPLSETDPIENSGKRLSGEFLVSSIEDGYRLANSANTPQISWTFDANATLKRQDRSRAEEGSYLINAGNELIIYIEKINGEPLADARAERYLITNESGDTITLKSPSRILTLRRR